MEKTYSTFKLHTHCLAVVYHEGRHFGDHNVYALNPLSIPEKTNILDVGIESSKVNDTNEAMDMITRQLGYFIEFTSQDRFGSPFHHILKSISSQDSAWVDIFTYDVYLNLGLNKSALRYENETLSKYQKADFPKNQTFWFRDWFLPIYKKYKGNAVLKSYFQLLYDYVSPNYYKSESSSSRLSMGEFVHYWSGAAGVDLTPLAWKAFGWTREYQSDLEMAQSRNNLYKVTSEIYNWTETDIPTQDDDIRKDETIRVDEKDKSSVIIGVSTGSMVLVLIAVLIIFVIYHKNRMHNLQREIRSLTANEVKNFFDGDPNVRKDDMMALVQASPFIKDYEISKDRLILSKDDVLGSGEYGRVIPGFIRQLDSCELLPVAVKTVKPDVEVSQFKTMLSEAKIMAYLGKHENIVLLCGTHTDNIKNREIYIALEVCTLGDLQKFLKNNASGFNSKNSSLSEGLPQQLIDGVDDKVSFSFLHLFKWSHDISNAMVYLTEKNVIHGDLAARNVLLTVNRVAKVSDFGLSRQLLNYSSYKKTSKTPLPWRWMAVESLQKSEFSIASDVWAFGVTLWEIFSLGDIPYPGWNWDYGFVDRLAVKGDRLLAPRNANPAVFKLMQECWELLPSNRPSFQTIYNTLADLVRNQVNNVGQNYLDLSSC